MARTRKSVQFRARGTHPLRLEGLESRDVPASFVSITGGSYTQNFDALGTATVTNLSATGVQYLDEAPVSVPSLNGWSVVRVVGSGAYPLTAGTGSVNTGGAYNFATAAATTDRAFGTILSGTTAVTIGVVLRNDTGAAITAFDVAYNSEQYRRGGGSTLVDRLDFQYQLGAADVNTGGTWTFISTLSAMSVDVTNGIVPSIDGNGAGRLARSGTFDFTSTPWAAGQTLVIRWVDFNVTSSDDGLAVDDFVLTVPGGSTTPSITTQPTNQTVTAGGTATFTAAATGTPPPAVKWQVKVPGGSFTDLTNAGVYSGVDTNTLTVTGATVGLTGNLYRAVYTNTAGSATTNEVSLTVNSAAITVNPATLPDPVLASAYSQTVTAAGGSGSFTFTVGSGLPPGLVLSTAGALTGTPTAAGTYTFTVLATDTFGSTGTRAYTLVVPLGVGPTSLPNGTRGVAYSQTVTATGGTAPYTFGVTGSLPSGLTLDTATGVISGTPDTANTFNFTITATDSASRAGSRAYTVVVAPSASVSSIVRVGGPNTNAASVAWTVTFSQAVSGLTAANFTLADQGNSLTGEGITAVAAVGGGSSDTQWTVTASTGTAGDGVLRLNVASAAGVSPTLLLPPSETTTADFVIDRTPPTVVSVVRVGAASVTNAAQVQYLVTFDAPMTLGAAPFSAVGTGSLTGLSVANVTGGPTAYTVTVGTGSGDGTLTLNVTAGADVRDLAGNPLAATFTAGESFTLDRTPPAVSIGAPSMALTAGGPVTFTVTYTDANLAAFTLLPGQVTLNPTGTATATIGVSGSGNTRTITLSAITGNGTLGISLLANTAADLAGNPAPAAGPSATFGVDNTAPTVTSVVRVGAASVTNAAQVQYTVTFSEPMALGAAPFAVTTTGTLTGTSVTNVSGGPTTFTVTVGTGSGDGTLTLNVTAGADVRDLAGNPLAATYTAGESFTLDRTPPAVSIGAPSTPLTAGGPVTFLVTYTDANLNPFTLLPGQVILNPTGTATATIGVSGSGNTRTITLSGITGDGTLGISLPAGTATDAAGNLATAAGPSATVSVDNAAPVVQSAVRVGGALTNAGQVQFSVTFSEDVSGVSPARFTPVGGGTLSGLSVGPVTGGPRTYFVTVNTGTGDGPLGLTVPASTLITDAAGNQLAAAFSGSETFTLDRTPPTVTIGAPSAPLTRSGPVTFTVTYTDANGVTPSLVPGNITLNATGSATATIGVSGSGNTRTVTLSGITGDGTLGISLVAGTAVDGATNPAPGAGPSATVAVDNTAPLVSSVVRAAANPTNAAAVQYTVTFNEDIGPPPAGAFTLTGTVTGAGVTTVTVIDPRTYTVSVTTGSGDGTLRLDVPAGAAITDTAGNPLAVSFTSGDVFMVLKTAPTVVTTTPTNGSVVGPLVYGGTVDGTAADALGGGVTSVSVTIQRSSDGSFWNGAAWAIGGSLAAAVTGSTWSVPFPAAEQSTGLTYTIVSAATDGAGNASIAAPVAYQWDAAPAAATVALAGTVFGPNSWPGSVGGAATDTGPAGVAVVNVVVTRSSDGFRYNAATQTWVSGAVTNAVTPAAGAWSLPLPAAQFADGVGYMVSAAAVDAVGNAQASPASASFTFDAVAPISTVTAPAAAFAGPNSWPAVDQLGGTVNDAGAAVSLAVTRSSDGFFWTGSAWQSASAAVAATVAGGSWTYTLAAAALADGLTYTVASTATDGVGNVQAVPGSRSFTWDAAAPTQTLTTPADGSFTGPITFPDFAGTAADTGSGVAAVDLTLTRASDGFVWNGTAFVAGPASFAAVLAGSDWSISFDPANLTDGDAYTLSATARDVVGNVAGAASVTFTFDAAGPSTTITAPAAGTATVSNWTGLAGTAADGGAGVQLVEYRVLDAAGLVWDGGAFTAAGGWFSAAGTTTWSAPFPFANFPAGGDYRVEARGTDALGNVGPVAAVDFTVTVPAVADIVALSPAVTNTTDPVTWRVTFTDPVGGVTAANFALVGSFGTSSAITDVTQSGPTTWDVTATVPAAGTGMLGLNYVSNVGITPAAASVTVVGAVYTLDREAPTVGVTNDAPAAVIRANQPVRYTVTFADDTALDAAGLTADDVSNDVTTGAAPFRVDGFALIAPGTYAIDVTLTGAGDFRLLLTAPVVTDTAGNALAVPVVDATTLTADAAAPTVLSVVPAGTSPTNAASVSYVVTFSEPVSGVDAGDFVLTTTGTIVPGAITVDVSSGTAFTVTIDTGSGDGTLRLDVVANGTILDAPGNPLADGFTTAAAVEIDRTAPTAAVTLADGPFARTQPVRFVVTFTEEVGGFGPAGVQLGGSAGGLGTATKLVTNPSGDGRTFLVEVSGLTADGAVNVTIPVGAASDVAGNALVVAATSPDVTLDQTAPTVESIARVGGTPTNAASVTYTVTFSEAVSGVGTGDFALVVNGLTGATISSVGGGGAVWTVLVTTGSGDGDLRLDLRADATALDAAGNPLPAGAVAGDVVVVDRTAPTATITAPTPSPRNTPVDSVAVSFDQGVTGLDLADFRLTRDGVTVDLSTALLTGTGSGYTLGNLGTLTGTDGDYNLTLTASGADVRDAAGNLLAADAAATFTVDVSAPTVTITPAVAGPTNAATVAFTVAFTEAVLNVDTDPAGGFDFFAVTGTAPGTAVVAVTPGVGGSYTVTVDTGSGSGTVGLTFAANTVVRDAAGNAVSGLPAASGFTAVDHVRPAVAISDADPDGLVAVNREVLYTVDVTDANGVTGTLTAGDFENAGTAGITVGAITRTVVSGGLQFTVAVTPITGGTLQLRLRAGAAVADPAGNAPTLPALAGRALTVDASAPTVVVSRADGQAAATNTQPLRFLVVFSEPVVGFDAFPFVRLSGPGTAGAGVSISGDGRTFVVAVSALSVDGPVTLTVPADVVPDVAGNINLASTGSDNTVTLDTVAPTIAVTRGPGQPAAVTGTDAGVSVTFTVTASEAVGGLSAVRVTGSAGGTVTSITGGGTTYLVTVGGITQPGSVSIAVDAGAGADAAGNPTAAAPPGEAVDVTIFNVVPRPTGQNSTGVYAAVTGTTATLFNPDGSVRGTAAPFSRDESKFGVRVAVADVTGDGVPDVIAGTAPGVAAAVRVVDGASGETVYSFGVFEGFRGGVFVAAGDLNGDGRSEFVVTPDEGGGARVLVFDGATGRPLASFLGIDDDAFRGGARVAVGDLNADGVADLVVSAGFGGGPRVAGFDGISVAAGTPAKLFNDFFLFDPALRDGAFVTVGDLNGDGYGDVIGGAGPGGAPHVLALSGFDLVTTNTLTPLASFFAGPSTLRGGVRVAAKDFDGDGLVDLVTGSGDTGTVLVYTNAALSSADPRPDRELEVLPGLLPGVHVG